MKGVLRSPAKCDGSENPLLPAKADDFMITVKLLLLCGSLLLGQHLLRDRSGIPPVPPSVLSGKLYFQSNVEDIAVYFRGMIERITFDDISLIGIPNCKRAGRSTEQLFKLPSSVYEASKLYPVRCLDLPDVTNMDWAGENDANVDPRRRQLWIAGGGAAAIGPGWLPFSILPMHGRTETEVARNLEGKPIYRIVFLCYD